MTVAKIALEREKRLHLLGRNRVSKVEPVGTVGSKKLPLSISSPTGASEVRSTIRLVLLLPLRIISIALTFRNMIGNR